MGIKKKLIILIGTILILIIFINSKSYAALQANGAAGTQQIINNWIVNIRKMEALGGGMGLTETIKTDLTPNTPSNNLDVHMEKNTEYGAMAILSASSYGNPNKVPNGGTTTGNKTGIVINFNSELVAAGNDWYGSASSSFLQNVPNVRTAAGKYKHIYEIQKQINPITPTLKGDAMAETSGWHDGTSNWYTLVVGTLYPIVRSHKGSIFSYDARDASYLKVLYSRAAMVCGEGI